MELVVVAPSGVGKLLLSGCKLVRVLWLSLNLISQCAVDACVRTLLAWRVSVGVAFVLVFVNVAGFGSWQRSASTYY